MAEAAVAAGAGTPEVPSSQGNARNGGAAQVSQFRAEDTVAHLCAECQAGAVRNSAKYRSCLHFLYGTDADCRDQVGTHPRQGPRTTPCFQHRSC